MVADTGLLSVGTAACHRQRGCRAARLPWVEWSSGPCRGRACGHPGPGPGSAADPLAPHSYFPVYKVFSQQRSLGTPLPASTARAPLFCSEAQRGSVTCLWVHSTSASKARAPALSRSCPLPAMVSCVPSELISHMKNEGAGVRTKPVS